VRLQRKRQEEKGERRGGGGGGWFLDKEWGGKQDSMEDCCLKEWRSQQIMADHGRSSLVEDLTAEISPHTDEPVTY